MTPRGERTVDRSHGPYPPGCARYMAYPDTTHPAAGELFHRPVPNSSLRCKNIMRASAPSGQPAREQDHQRQRCHQDEPSLSRAHRAFSHSARSCAARFQAEPIVAFVRGRSCVQQIGSCPQRPRKSTDMIGGRPTYLTVTCSQKLRSASFGRKALPHILQRHRAAACAKPSAISAAANGLVMPSRPSCQKFSNGEGCATSA